MCLIRIIFGFGQNRPRSIEQFLSHCWNTKEAIEHRKIGGRLPRVMPGLTADAKILAVSEGCPRQIVEYSKLVYGFQCHMELTREVVELLIGASEPELGTLTDRRFVQQPATLRQHDWNEMNQNLFTFLDKLVAEYQAANA